MSQLRFFARVFAAFMQRLALVLFAFLSVALFVATALAIAGVWPWIELPVAWNGAEVAHAGVYAQVGLTILAISLAFFLPSNWRIMELENSHRKFDIGIDDVTRAYHAAHAADRDATFRIGDAFEEMRDRLAFLRDHPDLGMLEPELLELAAKMSHISRDLAEAYSTTRVERARSFLQQRQFEIEQFNERLAHAKAIHSEFSNWINRIELDENVARTQMERLLDELERMLPELNTPPQPAATATITKLPSRAE